MKTSSLLLTALLGCGACKSPITDGGEPAANQFSFQLLDGETAADYFGRPGVLSPDSMVLKYRLIGDNSESKAPVVRVGGKVYFGPFNLLQQPTQPDGTTVNTLLLQLGKRARPDTMRLVSAPWTRRAVFGKGEGDYPTRFTFFFNRRLAADYNFLIAPGKDSLINFYQLPLGQIIRLRKK